MAAILKYRLPVTSGIIRNNGIELLDPENVEIAVGTALLSGYRGQVSTTSGIESAILNSGHVEKSGDVGDMTCYFC